MCLSYILYSIALWYGRSIRSRKCEETGRSSPRASRHHLNHPFHFHTFSMFPCEPGGNAPSGDCHLSTGPGSHAAPSVCHDSRSSVCTIIPSKGHCLTTTTPWAQQSADAKSTLSSTQHSIASPHPAACTQTLSGGGLAPFFLLAVLCPRTALISLGPATSLAPLAALSSCSFMYAIYLHTAPHATVYLSPRSPPHLSVSSCNSTWTCVFSRSEGLE